MMDQDTHPLLYFTGQSDAFDTAIIEARLEPNARTRDGREPDIVLARMPIGMTAAQIYRALDHALASVPRYWVQVPRGVEGRTVPEPDHGLVYRLRGSSTGIVPERWGSVEIGSSNAGFDPIRFLRENGYL